MSADGAWKITINTPMGAQQLDATITTAGDSFTGVVDGPMGKQDIAGKIDGDNLTWNAKITQPMPMELQFAATVTGDAMTGKVQLGAFGSADLSGVRA
ncbi:hypothetical protein [Phenylobacterium sp.]|uniref:hypothetical protein n=1 Tax=Phenylobacterium sp. TaxID=1871053 RepID=UPI00273611D6|nr:hypothetical protein [Phenylobacterium sp.]MDP3175000.1 hypothetical protein [Phenylobacterium sp.]MDP3659485.1 hypothetical protein [Phenylobacterium sp.]